MPSNCVAEVQCTLPVLVAFEKLYQTALYVFELTRATSADQVEVSLSALSAADRVIAATEQVKRRARALSSVVASRKIDHPTSMLIDKAFAASGLTKFAMDVAQAGGSTMVKVILARHMDVQAGKFDGAIRKAPWICESNGRVRLTAQRHRLPLTKVPAFDESRNWVAPL